jgi:hypothetical protein
VVWPVIVKASLDILEANWWKFRTWIIHQWNRAMRDECASAKGSSHGAADTVVWRSQ